MNQKTQNKEYIDREIAHLKELRISDQKAIDLARVQMESRLEGMNEFRAQLKDQSATFVTVSSYGLEHKSLSDKVDSTQDSFRREFESMKSYFINSIDIHSKTNAIETDNLKKEIQVERELRKAFEGSVNTWKWIFGFLGASGIGGIILLLISK